MQDHRVRLSVDINSEEKRLLTILAALQNKTISALVVEAVREKLAQAALVEKSSGSVFGAFSAYADGLYRERESSAWGDAVAEGTLEKK